MSASHTDQASRPLLTLNPGQVTLADLRRIYRGEVRLEMAASAWAGVRAAQATVQDIIDADAVVYGINTGFGKLAQTRIPNDKLTTLQRNLVLSHSVGTGPDLGEDVVRVILAIKAVSLARGHSGVRPEIIEALLALANHGVTPCIPAKGSVGASGDLAPLAHMSCTLIGVGDVIVDGRRVPAAEGLAHAGLQASNWARRKAWRCSMARRFPRRWRWRACLPPKTLSPPGWWLARCRSRRSRARSSRSTRASMKRAARPARSPWPAPCARCSTAARSSIRTRPAAACRIRTRSAASRRSWALAWTTCSTPRASCASKRMRPRTIRWCSRSRAM